MMNIWSCMGKKFEVGKSYECANFHLKPIKIINRTKKTLTVDDGIDVWNHGGKTYFSSYTSHYIFDPQNKNWTEINWKGLANFNGGNIWNDGKYVHYSNSNNQYILNPKSIKF